jgi:hypothetical protein
MNGYPESDWDIRPWFYTWSLASRLSPAGSDTVHVVESPALSGVRAAAVRTPVAGGYDLTVMLVNDSDTDANLSIVVPEAAGPSNLVRYDYLASATPQYVTDANGLARPAAICSANLAQGAALALPARSAMFLSTLDGGSPVPTAPLGNNLAVGKLAMASSMDGAAHPPQFATDGKGFTRWSSAYQDNQWLKLDLGAVASVSRVRIMWEAAYAQDYAIQVSVDGTNWSPVAANHSGRGGAEELTFAPVNARYVELVAKTRATQYGFSVYELGIYQ